MCIYECFCRSLSGEVGEWGDGGGLCRILRDRQRGVRLGEVYCGNRRRICVTFAEVEKVELNLCGSSVVLKSRH
jgi:hypothetical protein